MNEFDIDTYYRETKIDGLGPWKWRSSDEGAWLGPHLEWQATHKHAYLKHLKGNSLCIQAGGNHGLYPRLLAEHFHLVYTFEPDAKNFHCLVNNCQSERIIKIQGALGDTTRLVGLNNTDMNNTGTYTLNLNGLCTIPQFKIDSFNFPACDFIQLDIEGYEGFALQGALKTIEKFRPVISCERGDSGVLKDLGYTVAEVVGADVVYVPLP